MIDTRCKFVPLTVSDLLNSIATSVPRGYAGLWLAELFKIVSFPDSCARKQCLRIKEREEKTDGEEKTKMSLSKES